MPGRRRAPQLVVAAGIASSSLAHVQPTMKQSAPSPFLPTAPPPVLPARAPAPAKSAVADRRHVES
eukprot:4009563-Prymnesium_polylepis.1